MKWVVIWIVLFFSVIGYAKSEINLNPEKPKWNHFKSEMIGLEKKNKKTGLGYIISGGVALLGGIYGFYSTGESIQKLVFAGTQSIGIAAVGEGVRKWSIGNADMSFYRLVEDAGPLSLHQKDRLLSSYIIQKKTLKKKERVIKAVAHWLIAVANGLAASQVASKDLQVALYFIGGANAAAALSYTF